MNRYLTMLGALMLIAGGLQAAETAATPDAKVKELYKAKCQMCHGADAAGNAKMAAAMGGAAKLNLIDDETLKKTDEALDKITLDGSGKMPAFKGKVKPEEVAALTAYIRSLAPKKQ